MDRELLHEQQHHRQRGLDLGAHGSFGRSGHHLWNDRVVLEGQRPDYYLS